MIAVDTNVLLRRLLEDDAIQAGKARRIFETENEVLVTDVVLAEAIWTLTGRRYKTSNADIAAIVVGLLEEKVIVFESKQAVWSALNDFMAATQLESSRGDHEPSFADALIVNKAKVTAALRQTDYRGTYTFDEAALTIDGTMRP